MLAMDMGTGKTLAAIALALAHGAKRLLVACPHSVVGVWPRELRQHTAVPWVVARCNLGSTRKNAAEASRVLDLARARGVPAAVVVNHEALWREPFRQLVEASRFDVVVLDESHRAKAPGGRLSMFLGHLAPRVPWRLALTGTPLPHSLLDAYAQYRFLDRSIFGTSFTRFKGRFAVMGGYGNHQVVGWRNVAEFEELFYRIAFRVKKDDVLDLPEEVDVARVCELEPGARKIYDDLEQKFYAKVGSGEITASNALTKLLRLQQLTGGILESDDGELVRVSDAKVKLLADVLEDLPRGEPVVVFARFVRDLDAIRGVGEALGLRVGEVSGRHKDLTEDSKMPDWVELLAVQIQSGGVGIDLTRAATAINFSLGWSLGDVLQSRARLHRPGQTRKTTYVHLVAEGTIDEVLVGALRRREQFIESVLSRRSQPGG
jgi:SNF2 family DNA or RNA helicase